MKFVFRIFFVLASLLLIIFVFRLFFSPVPPPSGARYFTEYCASCHGTYGMGDRFLKNKPFKKEDLSKIIDAGIPGTGMPKFDYLPKQTKEEIIDYLLSLRSTDGEGL